MLKEKGERGRETHSSAILGGMSKSASLEVVEFDVSVVQRNGEYAPIIMRNSQPN